MVLGGGWGGVREVVSVWIADDEDLCVVLATLRIVSYGCTVLNI